MATVLNFETYKTRVLNKVKNYNDLSDLSCIAHWLNTGEEESVICNCEIDIMKEDELPVPITQIRLVINNYGYDVIEFRINSSDTILQFDASINDMEWIADEAVELLEQKILDECNMVETPIFKQVDKQVDKTGWFYTYQTVLHRR